MTRRRNTSVHPDAPNGQLMVSRCVPCTTGMSGTNSCAYVCRPQTFAYNTTAQTQTPTRFATTDSSAQKLLSHTSCLNLERFTFHLRRFPHGLSAWLLRSLFIPFIQSRGLRELLLLGNPPEEAQKSCAAAVVMLSWNLETGPRREIRY